MSRNTLTRIEKIGGDDSFRMRKTRDLILSREKEQQCVYFFSAFKNSIKWEEFNTTGILIEIWTALAHKSYDDVYEKFSILKQFYLSVIEREFEGDSVKKEDLSTYCHEEFELLKSMLIWHESLHISTVNAKVPELPNEANDYAFIFCWRKISLLGFWEIMTTKLFHRALLGSAFLDMSDILSETDLENSHDPVKVIYEKVAQKVSALLEQHNTIVVPGYVGFIPGGIIPLLGRGYSDVSSASIFRELKNTHHETSFEFAIKKLFVICSADPRIVGKENVRVIRNISLRLLLEMIGARWAGSPFINRNAINPEMFTNGWTLRLYSDDDQVGSVVTLNGDIASPEILFVQSKPVKVINIISYHFARPWYIEKITHFFKLWWLSIDNVVSSETVLSFTFNAKDMKNVGKMIEEFKDLLEKEDPNVIIQKRPLSEIYIGGENINHPGLTGRIGNILAKNGINIETTMQPLNPIVMIYGVSRENENNAVIYLHQELIKNTAILH